MVYYKVVKDQGNGSNLFLSYINAKALIQERNKLLPELISSFGFLFSFVKDGCIALHCVAIFGKQPLKD